MADYELPQSYLMSSRRKNPVRHILRAKMPVRMKFIPFFYDRL